MREKLFGLIRRTTYAFLEGFIAVAIMAGLMSLGVYLTIFAMWLFGHPWNPTTILGAALWPSPFVVAWSMFMVGLVEETLFRHILQHRILEGFLKIRPWLAISIASVVFGCAHFINPGDWLVNLPQVVGATFAGYYLGMKYRQFGLLFVIMVHAIYNFFISALIYWV
jgi:membrane protease YdiL (CAAX protease family)